MWVCSVAQLDAVTKLDDYREEVKCGLLFLNSLGPLISTFVIYKHSNKVKERVRGRNNVIFDFEFES